ncbi:sugar kinase [Spirosoma sordidisoli]|uniref:Sugar kinase n=1 Tax=Spirosoma sordidisoli TaxID=2502893 RepID=A0A4Q2UIV8_9BACT|nr:sugar kinase [Spirosoma sordidisoli]RYC69383.1 sugar kinase [Spirosoma sordidisoli]
MRKVVTFGETMMRLTTCHHRRFGQSTTYESAFAGGESNVASALAKWAVPVVHVTRLPKSDLGDAVVDGFKSLGIDTRFIQRGGRRLGLFFVEKGVSIRAGKVIYDRADSAFATLSPADFDWPAILEGSSWLHFTGISPAISENAARACLEAAQTANRMRLTVSMDVAYRSNLWQWGKRPAEVVPELVKHCTVIVCSPHDTAELFGIYPRPDEDPFRSVCRQLMGQFPALTTIITTERGQQSASHNTLRGKCWQGGRLLVTDTTDIPNIVDRIGGGDAFMAGFIYASLAAKDTLSALRFGVAASALKHTIDGDLPLASVEEIETIMNGDTSGRLTR